MNIRKRTVLRFFFAGEMVAFAWMYLFSAQGMKAVVELRRENNVIEQSINETQREIVACERELCTWQKNSFYKEKIAREQLQMARTNEEVYYLT